MGALCALRGGDAVRLVIIGKMRGCHFTEHAIFGQIIFYSCGQLIRCKSAFIRVNGNAWRKRCCNRVDFCAGRAGIALKYDNGFFFFCAACADCLCDGLCAGAGRGVYLDSRMFFIVAVALILFHALPSFLYSFIIQYVMTYFKRKLQKREANCRCFPAKSA